VGWLKPYRACLLGWLWSARSSDQTVASQSSVATGHSTLFGTLAQLSLDIFRLCLWRTAGSPTSGNQSSIGHFALRAAELPSFGNFWRTRRACPNLLWILRSTSSKAGPGSQTHGVHSQERSPAHEPPFQTPP
jgi:hypothetical protein